MPPPGPLSPTGRIKQHRPTVSLFGAVPTSDFIVGRDRPGPAIFKKACSKRLKGDFSYIGIGQSKDRTKILFRVFAFAYAGVSKGPHKANRARRFGGCGAARCAADRLLRRAGPVLAAAADKGPSRPTKISEVGTAPTIDIKVGRCRGRTLAHVRATGQNGARRPTGARFWVQGHFCASKNGLGRVWAGEAHDLSHPGPGRRAWEVGFWLKGFQLPSVGRGGPRRLFEV